jgi:hypothetical protein
LLKMKKISLLNKKSFTLNTFSEHLEHVCHFWSRRTPLWTAKVTLPWLHQCGHLCPSMAWRWRIRVQLLCHVLCSYSSLCCCDIWHSLCHHAMLLNETTEACPTIECEHIDWRRFNC